MGKKKPPDHVLEGGLNQGGGVVPAVGAEARDNHTTRKKTNPVPWHHELNYGSALQTPSVSRLALGEYGVGTR